MRKHLLFLLLLGFGFLSCNKEQALRPPFFNPELAETLLAQPDTLSIAGHTLYIQPYIYRDFMPVSPPDGQPLISIVRLLDADSAQISADIVISQQHIVYGDLVWSAACEEPSSEVGQSHVCSSRNGPKWGPDVEVVVALDILYENTLYRVAAKNVLIEATF